MALAANAVFSVQELCDEITCHIALHGDLSSAALVCHTLCTSAQSQIFHHVGLDPFELPDGYQYIAASALEAAGAALLRLSAILATSPHLLPSIRSLSVLARSEILEPLSRIRFPLLRRIRFNFTITPSLDGDAWHLARNCIALPSLRSVEVFGVYSGPHLRLELDGLESLLETCTPDLSALSLRTFHVNSPTTTARAPRPQGARRAQIKTLKLNNTGLILAGWLLSPSCPFDLTHLVDVEVDSDSTPLIRILTSARLSITRLRICNAPSLLVDLAQFPALACLELSMRDLDSSNLKAMLSRLRPDNCVQVLVFSVWHTRSMADIDAFVADYPMPVLRRVEAQVHGSSNGDAAVEFLPEAVRLLCPRLEARGLLAATDHRYFDPYV
ncbi:hypothetical protein DFH09DRAFT_143426 [Mycena vulgaris]|nr:hypothetical protein DFH09DRAFT_143426 [Mycena vulgaris]